MAAFDSLFTAAYHVILQPCCEEKVKQVEILQQAWSTKKLTLMATDIELIEKPGQPDDLVLVHPRQLKQRKLTSLLGRQAFIHALVHIEFNAINLALDAVYRFQNMPEQYYTDWLQVAVEEAYHFSLLQQRLQQLGKHYGDFPVHNGLWDMALRTADNVLIRMGLVPRGLEARGLDVTPSMIQRLYAIKDEETAQILEIIFRDEIKHVNLGSKWFKIICQQKKLDPESEFIKLFKQFPDRTPQPPFEIDARLQAGFTKNELHQLEQIQ